MPRRSQQSSIKSMGKHGEAKDPQQYEVFLYQLSLTANITNACEAAEISRDHAYRKRESDPVFAKRWEIALERGYDCMEEEVQRRAFTGVDEPVFYLGHKITTVKRYSDALAMFILKGRRRSVYGDKTVVTLNDREHSLDKLSVDDLDALIAEKLGRG
jgi:hypothetical protein